jgi:pseudaminic acid synthase
MKKSPVFFIAEMSGNHNQSFDNAMKLIDLAAKAGASAIKIQTYTADTITIKNVYKIKNSKSLWKNYDLYDLYAKASTPWEWHKDIFARAKQLGLICFSTPFDESSVDFLESLNNPIYKISSFETNHIPLLKYVAKTKKPVIMSTGVSTLAEIHEAVSTLRNYGCKDLTLLKCTSDYPADPINANISLIPLMAKKFNCKIGLSDHTPGIGVSIAAISLGAKVIEKHLCIDRQLGGVDSEFSMEPNEFKMLVHEGKKAFLSIGKPKFNSEKDVKKYIDGKRSIYIKENINKGDLFSNDNLKIIRPGFGVHPRELEKIIGKKSLKNLKAGSPLKEINFSRKKCK